MFVKGHRHVRLMALNGPKLFLCQTSLETPPRTGMIYSEKMVIPFFWAISGSAMKEHNSPLRILCMASVNFKCLGQLFSLEP
jgi:hypothetical protein